MYMCCCPHYELVDCAVNMVVLRELLVVFELHCLLLCHHSTATGVWGRREGGREGGRERRMEEGRKGGGRGEEEKEEGRKGGGGGEERDIEGGIKEIWT